MEEKERMAFSSTKELEEKSKEICYAKDTRKSNVFEKIRFRI